MSRNSRPLAEKKLDEEFPSLSSLPKRQNSAQVPTTPSSVAGNSPTPVSKNANPQKNQNPGITLSAAEQYAAFDIKSPESFLQTDLSSQDFGHALSSSLNYIPDTPYDTQEQGYESSTENSQGYPAFPNMRLMQPEFLKRFDLSTLFFIFFFSPGSSQQYFAGQELKRRDWIYNAKFQTWFHRLSEPTEKTASFEVAKFEYFDHSDSWCIRQRPSFKFEYDQLCE